MKNKNPFGEIRNAFEYAMKNGIDPKSPETWDEKYKKRMHKLAGIIPSIEIELKEIKKLF